MPTEPRTTILMPWPHAFVETDDDGSIVVHWSCGDGLVSLVCYPDGRLLRLVSPDSIAPRVATHVMELANGR